MGRYKSIAVIYGSDSAESEISCRSGEFTASRIDGEKYDVYEIFARFGDWSLVACRKKNSMRMTFPEGARPQVDKTDFSVSVLGEKTRFDFAYVMQHGSPGENGRLEGYLEMLGIPFSCCGSAVSSIAFDKFYSKQLVRGLGGVGCAPDAYIRKGEDIGAFCHDVEERLKFPLFVKPTQGGSSFGITRVCAKEQLRSAVEFAFQEDSAVLVEQGIEGRELTCAAYSDGSAPCTLPVIEIISENEYFDYDAKYNGHSQEVCPAQIPEEVRELVQSTTKELYAGLGCKGLVRIDYIYGPEGLFFLEVNTIPGMTSASLVPRMVRTAGLDMTDFLTTIIENN